jgi:hypothetical protein
MERTDLAQHRNAWPALVNTVIKLLDQLLRKDPLLSS